MSKSSEWMQRSDTLPDGRPGIDRPVRILHCPTDVGGNPQRLARMERELGTESVSVVLRPSRLQFEFEQVLFESGDGLLQWGSKIWSLLRSASKNFDIIHYNFGRPLVFFTPSVGGGSISSRKLHSRIGKMACALLEFTDVAYFRRAGKGIVVTYQGDDARQGDYCRENYEITFATEVGKEYYSARTDARKRRQIAKFRRHADRIYAVSPDLLNMVPAAELLPTCRDLHRLVPDYPGPRARPRVLHAPSHRGVKGTRFLLEAVNRLQHEGVSFDLDLIENLPNAEAVRRYREADLVVDQLLAGWYGGFAVEAMALGKPVIAYLREIDLHVVPREMRAELPVIDANPETIYDVLKEWLTVRRHGLPERGYASRAYAERWHDARVIARRLIGDYEAILRERETKDRHAARSDTRLSR